MKLAFERNQDRLEFDICVDNTVAVANSRLLGFYARQV